MVEALASGLPTLSTYHAGIPEVVKNNENGLLVEEGNVEQLTENLVKLIDDIELRKRLGTTAMEKAKELDITIKNLNLEKLYIDTLS